MKTVLITGASRGIGLATAKKFLEEGYFVVGTSQNGVIDSISSDKLKVLRLDISDSSSIDSCIKDLKATLDSIDILINNAGVMVGDALEVKVSDLRHTLNVNVIGLIEFTEKVLANIGNPKHIINLGSSMGVVASANKQHASYRISKAAVHMYSITLADRLNDSGVIVSCVSPGWVKTDMGGSNATREPDEAASDIYDFANNPSLETGHFWQMGEKRTW